ncbi:MAG TPA: winged helix-turn-helix domain-containing protein [Candidatus Limnocylindria bacterium]|nr:winged helix-turn-helix domain-containing protein [Candidatus Limnocylindria bacterium]
MIVRLFSSRAMYRTLALFFKYPDEPLNPRLISRHTGTATKSVLREIRKLEEAGIIRGWRAGQYKFYLLDTDHPAHDGFRSVFGKAMNRTDQAVCRPMNGGEKGIQM